MPVSQQWDKELGWVPAIPQPFWYRGWRTLFCSRPACNRCYDDKCRKPIIFENLKEWETHYVLTHLQDDEKQAIRG